MTEGSDARKTAVAAPSAGVWKNGFSIPVTVFPKPVSLSIPILVAHSVLFINRSPISFVTFSEASVSSPLGVRNGVSKTASMVQAVEVATAITFWD